MRTTIMTPSTPSTMTRTNTTRATCTSEHSSAPLVVFSCLDDVPWSSWLKSFTVSVTPSACHPWCAVLSDVFYLPFYFDLSFLVFFPSSVLMHPDLHTDLDNLDSVENNLRHSAKGSLDAYDVTFSLTWNVWVFCRFFDQRLFFCFFFFKNIRQSDSPCSVFILIDCFLVERFQLWDRSWTFPHPQLVSQCRNRADDNRVRPAMLLSKQVLEADVETMKPSDTESLQFWYSPLFQYSRLARSRKG